MPHHNPEQPWVRSNLLPPAGDMGMMGMMALTMLLFILPTSTQKDLNSPLFLGRYPGYAAP
ncbi:MAG: hypothetical protein K9N23_04530 [Akkermansiaceae bacterium]|nr:hypothetical protein [Akkermansiaceae bacterium]